MADARFTRQSRADLLDVTASLTQAIDDPHDSTPERFRDAVTSNLRLLEQFPGAGTRLELGVEQFSELRRINVGGRFRNYSILYAAEGDDVVVIRIVHAARDLANVLAETSLSE